MTNIIAGITKDLKAVPKKLKEKAKSADVKKADTAESSLCACRVLL